MSRKNLGINKAKVFQQYMSSVSVSNSCYVLTNVLEKIHSTNSSEKYKLIQNQTKIMKICNLFQCIFACSRNSPAPFSFGKVKRPRAINRWVTYFNQTCTTTCTSAVYKKQRLESLGFNFECFHILS